MAKKIHVSACKPGKFYIISGHKNLYFCLDVDPEGGSAEFQRVGDSFTIGVFDEKVKPVNIFMFSK